MDKIATPPECIHKDYHITAGYDGNVYISVGGKWIRTYTYNNISIPVCINHKNILDLIINYLPIVPYQTINYPNFFPSYLFYKFLHYHNIPHNVNLPHYKISPNYFHLKYKIMNKQLAAIYTTYHQKLHTNLEFANTHELIEHLEHLMELFEMGKLSIIDPLYGKQISKCIKIAYINDYIDVIFLHSYSFITILDMLRLYFPTISSDEDIGLAMFILDKKSYVQNIDNIINIFNQKN
eukprot:Pompholyxophrys_sp_v1_NODE_4_length_15125_cov_6.573656.p6 type:complete len:237 gc:universal NODE_4_length_15125_cov_6.573656:12220-11510(-)